MSLFGVAFVMSKVRWIFGLLEMRVDKARKREWEHYQRDSEPVLDDYNYRFFLEEA